MRRIILLAIIAALPSALPARADDVLYRCESADGISIQGTPCPKGVAQRKIVVQRPVDAVPTPVPQPVAPPPAPVATMPMAPDSAIRGPNDPYPLWQCMRADGSTFDSRTGIPGKQWVVTLADPNAVANAPSPAPITAHPKPQRHELIVRPFAETRVASDDADADSDLQAANSAPPPAGAAPGQWIADQCVQLDPQQACDRFEVRRDALRKQIYASKPSERATYAPEEQDLTTMLYAACGR